LNGDGGVGHGLGDEPRLQARQRFWSPVTRRFLGGCNVDRDIEAAVKLSGLEISKLDRFTLDSAMPIMGSMYRGVAVKPPVS